jgi:hypothetical protein
MEAISDSRLWWNSSPRRPQLHLGVVDGLEATAARLMNRARSGRSAVGSRTSG